jgi:eukaryotic-like serine/threonine-protein kinase
MTRPDTDHLRQLNALLETALDLPVDQRARWLDELPPQHSGLVPKLRSLLERANVETDQFLRHSAHALIGAQQQGSDHAGQVIGPYRLLSELGQGGSSTVWRAERCDGGLDRDVALKLPHAGWAHGIVQRMAQERDILASLEHPRIARLYDAGLTREGRPWLAMERVDGAPIDRHCRERRLGIDERLRLFLQVADAVAHAHARLVIHRDLKPGNILVTPEGQVRLLDFGVAKLMDGAPAAEQQLTRQLGRPVTPDYAAPELLGGHVVGTAADVYSLGVVLYELLCGERPYALDARLGAALEQAALQVETPAMSARAGAPADRRALRGDLDTIVAKALRKTASERYLSVEAFAADVQRHLDGLPVLAQAPSWRYRTAKFVRRHRLPLASATVAGASLLTGLAAALWQADTARKEAMRAERANQFVMSVLKRAQPRQGAGGAVMATDLLAAAGERIEAELAADPKAAAELGIVVGEGLNSLGDPQRAIAPLRRAVALAERQVGPRHPLTIHGRAVLLGSLGVERIDEGLKLADALVPDALAGLPATAADAVGALRNQSFFRAKLDQAEASYAPLHQAVALAERHLGPNHEETLMTLGLLANTYGRFSQYAQQLEVARDAHTRAQASLSAQRPNVTLTAVERWYAEALRSNSRPGDAIPILRRVLEDQRGLDGADTPRVRNAMYQLGLALGETGQLDEALKRLRDTVALEAQQNSTDNEDRKAFGSALAGALGYARRSDEALALYQQHQIIEQPMPLPHGARAVWLTRQVRHAQMLAYQGDAVAADQSATRIALSIGDAHSTFRAEAWAVAAMNARLQRRADEALQYAQRAWSDTGRAKLRPSGQAVIAGELATLWLDRGAHERAEALVEQSLALFDQAQVIPSPRMAATLIAQARLQLRANRAADAQRTLDPLIAAWQSVHPGSAWHGEALHWSAVALHRLGRNEDEATRQRDQARALLRASPLPALQVLANAPVTASKLAATR